MKPASPTLILSLVLALLISPEHSGAGVTLISRQTSVDATASTTISDVKSSALPTTNNFGPASLNVSALVSVNGSASCTAQVASQVSLDSSTGVLVVSGSGMTRGAASGVDGFAMAHGSVIELSFELTSAYNYTVTGHVTSNFAGAPRRAGNGTQIRMFSTINGREGLFFDAFPNVINNTGGDGNYDQEIEPGGNQLIAGKYRISATLANMAAGGENASASMSFDITLTPVGGTEPPTPTPIGWTNAAGGAFNTATNWNPQTVPVSTNTANFDLAATYTVDIGTAATDRLVIQNGNVTFTNMAYTVRSIAFDPASVVLNNARLTLASGQLNSGHALIGQSAASRVDVNSNAIWISTGSLQVGGPGNGFLAIAAGGTVISAEARIGTGIGGGDVSLGGTNASWQTGNCAVGFDGPGTLTIDRGALVESGDSFVGRNPGSTGHVIVQDSDANGNAALWDLSSHVLIVGRDGQGDVKILTGGLVFAEKLIIGQHGTGTGSMTVSGMSSGANPTSSGILLIDDAIIDGTLRIENGGVFTQLGHDFLVGFAFDGEATVRGFAPGGAFQSRVQDVRDLTVGADANGKLTIDQGGKADSQKGVIAANPGTVSNVLVQGSGNNSPSKWTLTDELTVGGGGRGSLQIKDGAQVSGTSSVIARGFGSVGSEIVVEGADTNNAPSSLTLSGGLTVGSAGVVALLQVKDGAVVNTGLVQVGEKTDSQGAVLVRGRRSDAVASTLVASRGMVVGGEGSGEMSVDAGGKVSVSGGNLVMGGPRNSPSAITIGGRDPRSSFGAAVTVAGNLILGSQADSTNIVTIREDGVLSCTEATIGSVGPSLSKLLVGTANGTGAPAEFRTTGDLSVGQGSAGVGFVVLSNGGIVTAGGSVVVNIVGIISGNGTLAVPASRRIVNGGRIQPGLSPGLLTFNGDFEQSATGVLEMQITGTTPGTAHDQLIVNGNASLGGKLVLKFAGGFGPRQGDQFKLLEIAGAMTGDFTEVAVEGLKAGFQYTAESNGIGQIVVTALTDGVPLPARGIFRGVLQGDPPGHGTSGFFTIQVTARGRFTAGFVFGGQSFATSGKFGATGKVAKTIPRKGRSALTINLELDKGDTVPLIKGTILDGTQSVIFSAERENAFTGKNPAPQAGQYTMLLPSDPAVSDAPKASGIGTVVIDKLGAIRFAGRLADGKLLSQGTVLSTTGKWPLYVLLYNKRGALSGELNFRDRTGSDFDGPLQWARPETAANQFLTAGFVATLPAIGSKYVKVPARPAVLDLPNGATATLSDTDLTPALTKHLMLIPPKKFAVLDPGADKFALSATKASGLLSARFTHPKTGLSTKVHGVVFQKQNFGTGFFLRPGTIGSFEIQALP